MSALLIIIIYFIFISLGLPDSLMSSSWPAISQTLNIKISMQGSLTIIISLFSITTSFLTPLLLKKMKPQVIIILSIFLTVSGLITFSFASNIYYLALSCVFLGVGAGAIDTTLNHYVALNYRAIHLNFLHAFWGIGASISPFIVGAFLVSSDGYKKGAFVLALIQAFILIITIISYKLWDKVKHEEKEVEVSAPTLKYFETFKIKGIMFALFAFFCYIAVEQTTFTWFSSMLVSSYDQTEEFAANVTGLFFLGITSGRIFSGLLSLKVKDKNMIRFGEAIILIGIILMMCSFSLNVVVASLFIVGFGCGPIYPCIVHATPDRFTKNFTANVMAIQMGFAYIANVSISPLFGLFAAKTTFLALPYYILLFLVILIVGNEIVLIKTKDKTKLLKKKEI